MIKTPWIILAVLMLTACQQAPAGFTPAPFAFEDQRLAPQPIRVATIRMREDYTSPGRSPYVEQDFPVSPARAVTRWVDTRLKATGQRGILEITIDDASVKEVKLPQTKGLKGLITDDQEARYDAVIAVTMRLYDGSTAISQASGNVEVRRSRSINERASVAEREAIYHQMVSDMMRDFERETQVRLQQYFSAYIR